MSMNGDSANAALGLVAGLGVEIGKSIGEELNKNRVVNHRVYRNLLQPSDINGVMDIGGPPNGKVWEVHRVVIWETSPFTTGADMAALFMGIDSQGNAECLLPQAQMAWSETFGHRELVVMPGNRLYAVTVAAATPAYLRALLDEIDLNVFETESP